MGALRPQPELEVKRVAVGLVVGAILVACGGQMPTPNADLVADTTVGKNRCSLERPFVVEWDATDFASFESKANRDLVFVKIEGCSLKVLDCRDDGIAAKYGSYDAPQWTTGVVEGFEIKNEGDLYAKLPLGASTLSGNLKGGNELQLKYFVSGSRPSLRSLIYRNDIATNPLCASATHFVAGYDMGAFDLTSKGNLNGNADLKAPSIAAGGNYAHSEGHVRSAGSLEDCKKETAKELARCRVPIRLSLRAIQDGANPNAGATPAAAGGNNALPPGMSEDFLALMQSSTRKMQLHDGPGCLADLDRAEAIRNNAMHNLAMVRANCEMLSGKCDDGRKRYRRWLQENAPQLTPEQLDESTRTNAISYCQGSQKTPAETSEAAKRDVIDANHKNDLAACTAAAKTFLDVCPKVGAGEKNGCDGAQYAAECIAKNGGDCTVARPTYELYVNRTYATSTPESRAATLARFKCSPPGTPPDTAKPPPNKKKGGKKKP